MITFLTCLTAENLPLVLSLGVERQPLFLPQTRDLLSPITLHNSTKLKHNSHSNHPGAIQTCGKL